MKSYYRKWTTLGLPTLGVGAVFAFSVLTPTHWLLEIMIGATFAVGLAGFLYYRIVPLVRLEDDVLVYHNPWNFSTERFDRERVEDVERGESTGSRSFEAFQIHLADRNDPAEVPVDWLPESDRDSFLRDVSKWANLE